MARKRIFIPFAPARSYPRGAADFVEGGELFLTAPDAGALERAQAALGGAADIIGGSLTKDMSLAEIAPAVIECAEKLGGIDMILFMPDIGSREPLFLDISPDDFTAHTAALNGFFMACKCALPYMMGGESPVIAALLPAEPANIAESMYRAAMESIIDGMKAEFESYGITATAV
ncbi:MAG: SDR family oxidoreductase [Synergistaceae bacterium]|nr:SDR family oxidoreductase [Synergistaceae bacterium]